MDNDPDEDVRAAKERGWRELSEIDEALARGEIDVAGWHDRVAALIEDAYLAADTAYGQSGRSGGAESWEQGRRLLLDLVERPGTFLDVGCANGLLMESVAAWSGGELEPYGVEIGPRLADLARQRCPQWADRIWTANAHGFDPGRRFDAVRTGLDYVPDAQRPAYLRHLVGILEPGGRVVVGVFNEEHDQDALEEQVRAWGFDVVGATTRPHRHPALAYKAFAVTGAVSD